MRYASRLLRIGGEATQYTAGQDNVGEVWLSHQAATELLHQQHGFQRSAVESAITFGKWQGGPAEIAKALPYVGIVCARTGRRGLSGCEVVFVSDKFRDAVAEHRLKFIE
ncbi:MAG: hypothetical protein O2907_08255 [Proteobacteria bacterium]|nr:hypothetical protein [Pseudomonadota bacterium]MDA1064302.1 hypothetical protein [Pseudomonadota bacterium]